MSGLRTATRRGRLGWLVTHQSSRPLPQKLAPELVGDEGGPVSILGGGNAHFDNITEI